MGRTNPTYRNFIEEFRQRWKPFRRALRKQEQEAFDRVMEKMESKSHAGSYVNSRNPAMTALFSILVAQEREIQALKDVQD